VSASVSSQTLIPNLSGFMGIHPMKEPTDDFHKPLVYRDVFAGRVGF